jgi:ketosteroid isomerase-like protein
MSSTPVETVREMYAAFGRSDLPALLEWLTEDVEWTLHGSRGLAYMRTARGKADVARWFAQVAELDDIQAFEPREFLAGPDHVTVLGWERTRALPEGTLFEAHWMHVFVLCEGRVARFVGLYDTAARP